ncbi:DUF4126 domain-containing protein [Aureimonas jatrophae]|uniref:Uncharacterized membrane protein n=1 Tax=Aureimonas jatrophae TaxID=1166073 RepID=A0A1H0F454_9HYPH|nr:DUF4126 domain-containing protein [Aureimonas jatrophae]MBB3950188.1 putative membrane protein [Aureimonas jatrophae]SDN89434.1 Uncharacterized membrane protein [Aureimonas jatrophae]
MVPSILMGVAAGARSLTPLAVSAWLARRGELPNRGRLARLLGGDAAVAGATLLAVGEILGDKMRTAPDRIVLPGMAARLATGAVAGAALAPRRTQDLGAILGAVTALASAHITFRARMRAMREVGQRPSGAAEDALVLALALGAAALARRRR